MYTIQSEHFISPKRVLLILLIILFILLWLFYGTGVYGILSLISSLVLIFQFMTYSRTTLRITALYLQVTDYSFVRGEYKKYAIELDKISSSYYEVNKFDRWELLQRPFLELLFPSGNSILIIHTQEVKGIKIPFNGNDNGLRQLQEKLPDRYKNFF